MYAKNTNLLRSAYRLVGNDSVLSNNISSMTVHAVYLNFLIIEITCEYRNVRYFLLAIHHQNICPRILRVAGK
jgi:hypothetical protein